MKKIISLAMLVALSGCATAADSQSLPEAIELSQSESAPETESGAESGSSTDQPTTEQKSISEDSSIDLDESEPGTVFDYGELEIEDQSGDGTSVRISEVSTSLASGLIVISNRSGDVLGTAKVSSAVQPVTVELTSPISSSQELFAKLYADNGNGEFDSSDLEVFEGDEDYLEPIEEDFDYEVR